MKKRSFVFCLLVVCTLLFSENVWAKEFVEEVKTDSQYVIYIPLSKIQLVKHFTKITDENGVPLYEVSPTMSYSIGQKDYVEREAYTTTERLKKFSRILYFGYGYEGRETDAFYFATQYLLYQVFPTIQTSYQVGGIESHVLDDEVAEIEKDMESVTFSLEDFITTQATYVITIPYIVDNFTVEGENMEVSYEKEKIVITFLNDLNHYELLFQPKNDCSHIKIWNSVNTELMPRREICESSHKVLVEYKKENTKPSEEVREQDTKEESDVKKESVSNTTSDGIQEEKASVQEVHVPNTYRSGFSCFFLLGFLGVVSFVFKK